MGITYLEEETPNLKSKVTYTEEQSEQPSSVNLSPAEQRIQSRPSAITDLVKNPATSEHPIGAMFRTLLAGSELYQGVPASIALDLQQGKPQEILKNLGKVITGQRPVQYGDVFRGSGLPEPLAAGMGLYTDIITTPGGAEGVVGIGKGAKVLSKVLKFDNALKRAETAKVGLDSLRSTLGKAKEIALQEVKDLPAVVDWSGNVSQKIVNTIKNPLYGVEFTERGGVVNTVGNLDKIKTALKDLTTSRDFIEAGRIEKQHIMRFAGRVRDTMLEATDKAGKPELSKALREYSDFMDNYHLINDNLTNKYGQATANKLKATFNYKAEPLVKEAWKAVSKASPEVKSVMDSMNKREILKNLLKLTTVGGVGVEVGKKIVTGNW